MRPRASDRLDRRPVSIWVSIRVSTRRRAPVKLAILVLMVSALAACSDSTPVAPASATESAAMVQKNCADPHWRDQNLGLWYSVCRQPLRW